MRGLLRLPIPLQYTDDFPILQYGNDTLIVMEACPRQLMFLKCMLNTFASSTVLKVNYLKSMLTPINIADDKTQLLANTFGCEIGSFPFTYMGLPLSLSRPNIEDFQPIVSRPNIYGFAPLFISLRLEDYNSQMQSLQVSIKQSLPARSCTHCPFAQECWHIVGMHIPIAEPFQVIQMLKDQLQVPFFMDIIIIMSWCIWMARNDLIFRVIQPHLIRIKSRFKDEFALLILRARPHLQNDMSIWLQAWL